MRECPARVRHVAAAGRTGLRRLWVSRALQPLSRTPKNRLRKNTVAAQTVEPSAQPSEPSAPPRGQTVPSPRESLARAVPRSALTKDSTERIERQAVQPVPRTHFRAAKSMSHLIRVIFALVLACGLEARAHFGGAAQDHVEPSLLADPS